MTATNPPRRGQPRVRVRLARLVLVLFAILCVAAIAWAIPNWLAVATRLPALNPLTVQPVSEMFAVAASPYSGRCVAVRVFPGGQVMAAIVDGNGLAVVSLWPDGRTATLRCPLPGDVGQAVFSGSGYLVAWATDRATGAAEVHAFGPITADWFVQAKVSAAWTLRTTGGGVALLPLAGGNIAAIGTDPDGTPARCSVLSGAGKLLAQWSLDEGIYTAWDPGGPAGIFALAGANYDASSRGMASFVRTYQAGGSPAIAAVATAGPVMRLAVNASGKHVLLSTSARLELLNLQDPTAGWSRRLPGSQVRALHVFPDGRVMVSGPDAALILDDRGGVVARFRATGQGIVCRPVAPEYALLSLPGGCAAIDTTGRVVVRVLWEGQSQVVASDATMAWLARADGTSVTLYGSLRPGAGLLPARQEPQCY